MRIRSTKPEFWRSKTIAALSWDARLVLKAVEAYVDDNGVGKDDLVMFASDAFARDVYLQPQETYLRLQVSLTELEEHGLVVRYEHEGEKLLYVDRWKEKVYLNKPSRGRFRRPDGTLNYGEDVDRASYQKIPGDYLQAEEDFSPQSVSQLVRGSVSQGSVVAPTSAELVPTDDAKTSARKRAQQLPDDWQPTDHHRSIASERHVDLPHETAQFRDYYRANGKPMKDWNAAFNTWLRRARPVNGVSRRQQETDDMFIRAAQRMAAREAGQ